MPDFLNSLTVALIVFVLAQLADVVTTVLALRRGGREGNPVFAHLMERLSPPGWIALKLVIACGAAALIVSNGSVWPLWLVTAVTLAVAFHNHRIKR